MGLQRYRIKQQRPNYFLAFLVFALVAFGLIMIYSASVVTSYQFFGYNYFYLNKQATSFVVGIICWFIAYKIDFRFWQKYSFWIFLVVLALLVAVFIPGVGAELQGARRWISIGPIFFQPSEIAKLAFIFYLAAWLSKKGEDIKNFKTGFVPFAIMLGLMSFLLIKEPDMGTALVMISIAIMMFFAGGAKLSHMAIGAGITGLLLWIMIKISPYRLERLTIFLNPSGDNSLEAGYHINQALLAIGSGGIFGLGFGQSKQKYLYLPEAHIDSIYAVIVEELGFLRSSLVIIAFMVLGYIGYKIAKTAPDSFSRLVAVGITTWIIAQAFLNMGTMLGVVPLTGVPLPFISYGGSSLIVLLIGVGILMNISKQCNR